MCKHILQPPKLTSVQEFSEDLLHDSTFLQASCQISSVVSCNCRRIPFNDLLIWFIIAAV